MRGNYLWPRSFRNNNTFYFEQFVFMDKSYYTISIVFTLTIMKPNWFTNEDMDITNWNYF